MRIREKKIFESTSDKNYQSSSQIQIGFGGNVTSNPIFQSDPTTY